jgi:23S rRNA (cytidine1920-2'-O)/16S rRNA (cytidine1409-2'-O)-methyltransferase
LVERGLFPTRTKAQAAILAGQVSVPGKHGLKAGTTVPEDAEIELAETCPYVSRGGLKLEKALDHFQLSPKGRLCLDVGASTGGFTDCLLQRGARKVYALDVGRGQLDDKVRKDARVAVMEKVNARTMEPGLFPEKADLAVVDVSFISAAKILPALVKALARPADLVILVKPQFELEPKLVPKGVVKDDAARHQAIHKVASAAIELGLHYEGFIESPIKGAKGNVEFLEYFKIS